jgi:hypothetical protein
MPRSRDERGLFYFNSQLFFLHQRTYFEGVIIQSLADAFAFFAISAAVVLGVLTFSIVMALIATRLFDE